MNSKRKSAPDTAISESAKHNNHNKDTTSGQSCKELTFEDINNLAFHLPMINAAAVAKKVAKKFDTRNPFEIASSMGFVVLRAPLTEIRGFLQVIRRIGVIYINDELEDQQSALVCAHELGHWFMHRGLNRAFLDAHTDFVLSKYEIEANRFAACLLFDDEVQ